MDGALCNENFCSSSKMCEYSQCIGFSIQPNVSVCILCWTILFSLGNFEPARLFGCVVTIAYVIAQPQMPDPEATMVKSKTQPKRSVHLDVLAEIDIRHQDRMIVCSFEIISRGSWVSTGAKERYIPSNKSKDEGVWCFELFFVVDILVV